MRAIYEVRVRREFILPFVTLPGLWLLLVVEHLGVRQLVLRYRPISASICVYIYIFRS